MTGLTLKEKKEKYPTEVYTRVVGFLSPVSEWNDAKKEELRDRKEYGPPAENNYTIAEKD